MCCRIHSLSVILIGTVHTPSYLPQSTAAMLDEQSANPMISSSRTHAGRLESEVVQSNVFNQMGLKLLSLFNEIRLNKKKN